jgi:hypothetical protein
MVRGTETLVDSQVGGRKLFGVGDAVYTWNDVVERARATGLWSELEQEARAGNAALRELAPSEEDVNAAARAFRYARGLLAGDELDAWLAARGLTQEAWEAYFRRSLARDARPQAEPEDEGDLTAETWVEGICSGKLEALARELAALVAVAPSASPEQLEGEFTAFRRAAATEAAIAREVESNRLQWLRVRYDAAAFDDPDVAGEVALCVRADGEPLADVAAQAGVESEERLDWLDEVDPELASRFFTAEAGDVVGPVPVGEQLVVAHVRAKTAPDEGDPDVRDRAAAALAERAVAREVNERVVWLEPL